MVDSSDHESLLAALRNGRRREEATRNILEVIQTSRDDEGPVFEAILTQSAELCAASQASLQLVDMERSKFEIAAYWGFEETAFSVGGSAPLDSGRPIPEAIRTGRTVNISDLKDTSFYRNGDPIISHVVDVEGVRSWLVVPLMNGSLSIGAIALSRKEVMPFVETEIHLVETIAAQAVIAIENVHQFREVQTHLERERATGEVLQVISRSRHDDLPVFQTILANASRLCGADRARLMMPNNDGTGLLAAAQWGETNPALLDGAVIEMVPEMLPVRCMLEKKTINVPDGRETEGYKMGVPQVVANIDAMQARSVLAVPLLSGEEAIGCIVLTNREIAAYDDNDAGLVETFAAQAVIAIENVAQFRALETLNSELEGRVKDQVSEIERMGKLKRFLPAAVADTVISSGSEKMLASHRALLGVLFCDIRGFTAFCETAEPEETIEVLQTYHEEMGKLINAHGAGVDHRMGDGIMVLFNDPIPCDDPAGDAVRLAVAMRARMNDLGKDWKRMGFRLGFGVGVSLGYATVGMVGYEGRSEYTASGTAINVAARLCEIAKDGEILLSTRAAHAVDDNFPSTSSGEVALKGIREPVEVFRLV